MLYKHTMKLWFQQAICDLLSCFYSVEVKSTLNNVNKEIDK